MLKELGDPVLGLCQFALLVCRTDYRDACLSTVKTSWTGYLILVYSIMNVASAMVERPLST